MGAVFSTAPKRKARMKKRKYSTAILIIIFSLFLYLPVQANPIYVIQFPAVGDIININISIDSIESGTPILSFQGNFSFDPAVVMMDTLLTVGTVSTSGIFSYSVDSIVGRCLFAYAGLNPIPSSGILFMPIMTVLVPGQINDTNFIISLDNMLLNEGQPEAVISYERYPGTDINENKYLVPGQFKLEQNYPNPFNPSTTIRYTLERHAYVELSIYDIGGRKTTTLVNKYQKAGEYSIDWNGYNQNGSRAASGIYLYRIKVNEFAS